MEIVNIDNIGTQPEFQEYDSRDVNLIEHFIKPIQISRNYLLETYKYSQRISEELDRIKDLIKKVL